MSDRLPMVSLRQFRERAGEIHEVVDIAVRDRDGNFQILGYFTPYMTYPVPDGMGVVGTGRIESIPVQLDITADEPIRAPKIIRTPEEAVQVAPRVRPIPKSAQTGRRSK